VARRGREAALKRAREKARQDKKEAKRERQQSREANPEVEEAAPDEQALMEEFARLSERYETNQISTEIYDEERRRIFAELGISTDE
jgi:hypothetical protein